MSFLNKIELKKQLEELGLKIEGNYVRKKDIQKVLAAPNVWEADPLFDMLNPKLSVKYNAAKKLMEITVEHTASSGRGHAVYYLTRDESVKFIKKWNDSRAINFNIKVE